MTSKDDSVKRQDELEQDATKSGVSRRQFLTAGSAAVAALAFQGRAKADSTPSPSSPLPAQATSESLPSVIIPGPGAEFKPPQCKNSVDGVLSYGDLCAKPIQVTYTDKTGTQKTITGRSYDGQVPGKTLYVNPGGRIEINFKNELAEGREPCPEPSDINIPHCFNRTNLHFHGLHVSPSSKKNEQGEIISSDDVLVTINPGDPTHKYCVQLPDDHRPGTHWYHAHVHGSTGIQVSNGMVGALIINEPSPELNMVADSEDKVWLIQELSTRADMDIYTNATGKVTNESTFVVNGQFQPVIKMETGKMQRWRFINGTGTPGGFMGLALCKYTDDPNAELDQNIPPEDTPICPMHLIAVDGISFYEKSPYPYPCNLQDVNRPVNLNNPNTGNFQFSPGNRADFLVLLPKKGMYKLIKKAYASWDGSIVKATENQDQVLAYVQVTDGNGRDSIPTIIPGDSSQSSYLSLADNPPTTQCLTFKAQQGAFTINGNKYDEDKTLITVNLNDTEDWVIETIQASSRQRPTPHPFHIHINPFQVVAWGEIQSENNSIKWTDVPESERFWQDTVAVEVGRPLKIRHTFKDFPGKFVLHCHILIHEDQGMMYKVAINDSSSGVGDQVST